jgi:ligand-binding SRPBCC domain-containing protein
VWHHSARCCADRSRWRTIIEDPTVDWSEFLTLVANLLILVSGPVFTVLHETGRGAVFRQTLEVVGAVVMTAAVVMAGVAQRHVWVAVRQKDGEDYKVRVVEARVLEAEERVKTLKHQLRTLKEVEAELEHQQEEERAYEPELARAIDDVLEAIETSDPNGDVPSGRASKLVSKQDMQVFDNPLTTDEAEA